MNINAVFFDPVPSPHPAIGIDLPFIDVDQFSQNTILSCKILISIDEEPKLILNIYSALNMDGLILEGCFKQIKFNQDTIAILHGMHVHLFNINSHSVNSISLNDYVGHLYSIPDLNAVELSEDFLIATFEYVFLINSKTGIKWRSVQCAIDGILIHDIKQNIIFCSGEWDPPGGWEPFSLTLNTGQCIIV